MSIHQLRRSCRVTLTQNVKKKKSETMVSRIEADEDQPKLKHDLDTDKKNIKINDHYPADGFLDVHEDELNLERTLLGGQSFRWVKTDSPAGDEIFTGVIQKYCLQLWRHNQNSIAFRRLNKDDIKPSHMIPILQDYLHLKYNLKDLYESWSGKDPHLAECCSKYTGFRILRQDPVENVFSFICATNNNIKRISQMIEKLCDRFGDIIETGSSVYDAHHSFPQVERLAQDDVFDCLRYELGFGYRAKFISETAKKLLSLSATDNVTPRDYLLKLRNLEYKDTCKKLTQFPGIGRKVADCICLMSMDHLNSVPIDCHIFEIVCRHYMPNLRNERKTLTESVHDMISEHFNKLHGPQAGWSTSILFISELKHLKTTEKSSDGTMPKPKNSKKKKTT